MESIRGHFAELTLKVGKNLTNMSTNVDDLRVYLTGRFGGVSYSISSSSVSDMIETATRNRLWDYYNYHALEGIIKHVGKDDSVMKGWIEEYKTRLNAFKAATKIAEYIKGCTEEEILNTADEASEDYRKLYDTKFYRKLSMKLDRKKNDTTIKVTENCLSYIDELWTSISDHFLLPPLPVLLEKIHSGCIEITWIIPEIIALIINSKATSAESIEFYRQKNIMHIKMNDTTVFNDDDDVDVTEVYFYYKLCCR